MHVDLPDRLLFIVDHDDNGMKNKSLGQDMSKFTAIMDLKIAEKNVRKV